LSASTTVPVQPTLDPVRPFARLDRELGIPCVVGTVEATRRLRDGEIVTVDATRGTVLEGTPPHPHPCRPGPPGVLRRRPAPSRGPLW
jgi:hypothetical protein